MPNTGIRSKLASLLGSAGVLLGAGNAMAYGLSTHFEGETWGNSDFRLKYG